MSNLQKLRRFINATEKHRMIVRNKEYGEHMKNLGVEKSWWINRKQQPHTQHNAQTLKILGFMKNRSRLASRKRSNNAMNNKLRAYRNLVPIYGEGINATMAARLVMLAELRAARAVAKALRSNAVLKRAQIKRSPEARSEQTPGQKLHRDRTQLVPSHVKQSSHTSEQRQGWENSFTVEHVKQSCSPGAQETTMKEHELSGCDGFVPF
jgi:hypothetical protein